MVNVTNISEINKVIALTDRVKKRKEEYLASTPHIDAARSRLVTESWKETEGESLDTRRAKLFAKVMEGLPTAIRDGELIVGSQSQFTQDWSCATDFNPGYIFDLTKSEGPMRPSSMKVAEVTEGEIAGLLQDAAYWKGKSPSDAIAKAWHEVFGDKIDDLEKAGLLIGPESKAIWAAIPDYDKVLNRGLNGIIAEAKERLQEMSFVDKDDVKRYYFLEAVIIACEGAIKFAHRYAELARELASRESNPVRERELETIADVCDRVPANPARSFREAVQSFWFTHLCVNRESSWYAETPGRMDQYLYPFYERDLDKGRLSREEAAELLGCLWIKFSEMGVVKGGMWSSASEVNQGQDVTIGGMTSDGRDASNELTYLLLEVVRQVKTVQAPLYLRIHKGTPEELWLKAVEVNRDRGDGFPAFVNDEPVMLNFLGKGIPVEEARDYVTAGCVHPFVNHGSVFESPCYYNVAKIFELTLDNGVDPRTGKQLGLATGDPRDFSSFDELYDAFKKQTGYFVGLLAKAQHICWQVRREYYSLPFTSALTDDCLSRGLSGAAGGERYPQLYYGFDDRGHQNVANSLAAIKKLVYEEKKISMPELLETLAANFEGKQGLQQMLLAAPKYGNDDDYVDEIHDDLSLWIQRRMAEENHVLGTSMMTSRGGATIHSAHGKKVGALPDGREAWTPLADGSLSPTQGTDVKGPTAIINSASRVNHTELSTASLFNMKFSKAALNNLETIQKLIAIIKTYFERGGYFVQFNLMGQEILLEAKKHPEKHRNLLVRVAGYSAYFVDLSSELQDDIIARTEHILF